MDLREYVQDHEETIRSLFVGLQKHMWTCLPVSVVKDSDGHTVSVQPTIKGQQIDQHGKVTHVDMPVLNDVRIHHMSGGGVTITTPIKSGDEGIVVFSSRPIDTWAQSGGAQQQVDQRMHSLSDGFYIPGVRSDARKIGNVSTSSTQIRTDDGQHVIDLKPGSGMTLTSGGVSMAMTPGGVAFNGGTITHNGKDIGDTHKHGGIVKGGDITDVPV
ncbi:Gp138 family membrane-puncturing spike protein [Labrys neptuniae]